jgi:membrane protein DedA with SNARE-associated domain
LTEHLVGQLGYVGIALVLILGGLGLPIPEEAPIILAGVLTRNEQMRAPLALASCLLGVLLGDLVVYFLGFFYGEKVLSLPMTRRVLSRQWEAQIKGYFHRHGFKILVSGRFVPGFRTAAYLTAGILRLPTLKLLLTDLVAASLSTSFMFVLGYASADQVHKGIRIRDVQLWATIVVAVGVAIWLLVRYYKARRRGGLPVGPPVLESDEAPLPSASLSLALAQVPAAIDAGLEADLRMPGTSPIDRAAPRTAIGTSCDRRIGRAQPEPSTQPATPPRRSYDPVALEVDTERGRSGLESPSR